MQNDSLLEKNIDFKVMPFINYDRNLKFMFGAIPMLMYKLKINDNVSPKSLTGLSTIYTTNNSYLIAFFNKWYFKEDHWRANFFIFNGNISSQFYIDDFQYASFYDYHTKTTKVSIGVQRKIIENLYGGVSYSYDHFNTTYEEDIKPSSKTHTNGIQLNLQFDSRNLVYYPSSGINAYLRLTSNPNFLKNNIISNKISSEYNIYFSTRKGKDVIASRFSGQFGLGDIAFEQQETIGGKDIRGYTQRKYRGDGLVALQGEYRYNFNDYMGLVGFGGIATIYGSPNKDFDWKAYPGLGVGYRYSAFKKIKFNIGLDAAVGKNDWGIYFRIGEAF